MEGGQKSVTNYLNGPKLKICKKEKIWYDTEGTFSQIWRKKEETLAMSNAKISKGKKHKIEKRCPNNKMA